MKGPRTTAIIGLGLMGGSLARDLAASGTRIAAYDTDRDVVAAAIAAGVVAEPLDRSLQGIASAGLIVIATPVDSALETLDAIAAHAAPDAVITDVGSVKRPIEQRARALGIASRFVGSHPLTGDHRSGWVASRDSLFAGVPVFICPNEDSRAEATETVISLWSHLGATIERLDAESHDQRMAWLSHLPQVASSALSLALSRSSFISAQLGPGGRDATRLAASSPPLWSAIATANADHITLAVDELRAALDTFRDALAREDQDELRALFDAGNRWRA